MFADRIEASLNLIVTDQPMAFDVVRPDPPIPQVSYVERFEDDSITVFVELGNLADEQWQAPLKFARNLLIRLRSSSHRPTVVSVVRAASIQSHKQP